MILIYSVYMVLELCCFEWFQNFNIQQSWKDISFRAVLFRMVPKPFFLTPFRSICFRAVLFRMVPKPELEFVEWNCCFRAVLFRMVPKPSLTSGTLFSGFRALLFQIVPKRFKYNHLQHSRLK